MPPPNKEEIMVELKAALDREVRTFDTPSHHSKSLDGILDSFITFYRNLKDTSQTLNKAQLKKNEEIQAAKDQMKYKDEQSEQLKVSLEEALKTKKVYMEELKAALFENTKYAAQAQGKYDFLNAWHWRMNLQHERKKATIDELATALQESTALLTMAQANLDT